MIVLTELRRQRFAEKEIFQRLPDWILNISSKHSCNARNTFDYTIAGKNISVIVKQHVHLVAVEVFFSPCIGMLGNGVNIFSDEVTNWKTIGFIIIIETLQYDSFKG